MTTIHRKFSGAGRVTESDEPGCLHFNVLQDQQDANVYYFFVSIATRPRWRHIAPRRIMPFGARLQTLPTDPSRRRQIVFPSASKYWD